MPFTVAVVYYSLQGRLVTLANVIAEGAKSVPGARVAVHRVADPVRPDAAFEEGVLDAPVASPATVEGADVVILGAPARQGGVCAEMRAFLDALGPLQGGPDGPRLRGKVGAAFTSVGGGARGPGGAESVLASLHTAFLHHAMVVVGNPPSPAMATTAGATPLGAVVVAGGEEGAGPAAAAGAGATGTLAPDEVRLGYALGAWAAQVGSLLHDGDAHGPASPGAVGGGAGEAREAGDDENTISPRPPFPVVLKTRVKKK
jgi:NAD(P)H dehydrogenase (quinone)